MITNQKKTYSKSVGKIQELWNIAQRLIGEYKDFDRRITALEEIITKISYTVSQKGNVNA